MNGNRITALGRKMRASWPSDWPYSAAPWRLPLPPERAEDIVGVEWHRDGSTYLIRRDGERVEV